MGSKSKVIERIARFFPNAENFYDLFGGGFSVSHYMIENRSKSYSNFYYNELRPGLPDLIKDAIAGKYSYKNFKPEWISRERFFAEKESNIYIKIVWSFGNEGSSYIFGKEIEQQKRSMHQAIIFDEFDSWFIDTFGLSSWPSNLSITGRRLYLRKICISIKHIKYGQGAANILQQLERLERLERLELTNLDYRQVKIKPNSVIYCDIPYKNTADYGNNFSHDDFFNWASTQENPVFISEYRIDDNRFFLLKEFSHRSTVSNGLNQEVTERLYGNKIAYNIIQKAIGAKHGKT